MIYQSPARSQVSDTPPPPPRRALDAPAQPLPWHGAIFRLPPGRLATRGRPQHAGEQLYQKPGQGQPQAEAHLPPGAWVVGGLGKLLAHSPTVLAGVKSRAEILNVFEPDMR